MHAIWARLVVRKSAKLAIGCSPGQAQARFASQAQPGVSRTTVIGDGQTICHFARPNRVATGKSNATRSVCGYLSVLFGGSRLSEMGSVCKSIARRLSCWPRNPRVPLNSRSSSSLHPRLHPIADFVVFGITHFTQFDKASCKRWVAPIKALQSK